MFEISLHRDVLLSHNIKYRQPFSSPAVYTTTAVNIGNFSNKNLYCDNTVELAMGRLTPPQGTEQLATDCNYIKIVWDGKITIGFISDWEYINDNNIKISYRVDAFLSARASNFIASMEGICERVNLDTNDFFTNLQSEPFSPSDIMNANSGMTHAFNLPVQEFEGVIVGSNGVSTQGTSLILTVSPTIRAFLGIDGGMREPPDFTPQLKDVDSFNFNSTDTYMHAGGVYRGFPLKFENMSDVSTFIQKILSGCGFRTELPPTGYSNQKADTHHSYLTPSNMGGGDAYFMERNKDGDPLESIRFINISDIYNLYCIPDEFTKRQSSYFTKYVDISGWKNLSNLHRFGSETHEKGKLLAYPYYYAKLETANGDTVNMIPQTFFEQREGDENLIVRLNLRYIGGDTPRLMARLVPTRNKFESPYNTDSVCSWFTVRSYPAVTLSINDSFNPQVQRDMQNVRKVSTVYANAASNARLDSPFKQGYLDAVHGESSNNSNRGFLGNTASFLGEGLGVWEKLLNGSNSNGLFSDKSLQAMNNEVRSLNVGNFITSESTHIMGNDFISQFGIPAFAVWDCGATDAELYTYSRYLEEFGTACNCLLNPLTNTGKIFAGQGQVKSWNGKTFYKFSNIRIEGVMPLEWKNNIKSLFESGVYLVD